MAVILIVDDESPNRKLLRSHLASPKHTIIEAFSGENALLRAAETLPDLALLDVMMPGISGYETARELKKLQPGMYLPIIFVTGLYDVEAYKLAQHAGADEFLTKPVNGPSIRLRIENLLALRANWVAMARKNEALLNLHQFKDEMSELIVHDLKNPATIILNNLEYIEGALPEASPTLQEAIGDARIASDRVLRLLANLIDVARCEAGLFELHRTSVRIGPLVESIVRRHMPAARLRGLRIDVAIDAMIEMSIDIDVFTRIIENLLDNAVRYTPRQRRVSLSALPVGHAIHIQVGNSGPAISEESRSSVFHKFSRGRREGASGMNAGLGLYFCRLAAEAHGGRIWVENQVGLPTVFAFEMPAS